MIVPDDIRSAPYSLGGRDSTGIDCLGVVMIASQELGNPIPDPWRTLLEQWRAAGEPPDGSSGFPDSWKRLQFDATAGSMAATIVQGMQDGDVWLWAESGHPGCGIAYQGRIWTAKPVSGVVSLDPFRAPVPRQVWRP